MSENSSTAEPVAYNLLYFIGLYFLLIWLSLFPSVLFGYWVFINFPISFDLVYLLFLILLFFCLYGIALFSSLLVTKNAIWLINKRISPPIIGSYPLTMENPNTRAHLLTGTVKLFARWLFYLPHLEFLRVFWLRMMGVKIGKKVKLGDHIEDEPFIEIGDNTFMAKNTIVGGHMMDNTHLTIFKSIIGKNCIINPMTAVVGGVLGDNSITKAHVTGVMKGQICHGNAIYGGVPCKKLGNYSDLSPTELKDIKDKIRTFDKINYIKEKNAPIKMNETSYFFTKLVIIIGSCLISLIFPLLYYISFRNLFTSTNHLLNIAFLTLVPIIILIMIAFFIGGVVGIIKLFLIYYDRKADIPEGWYDLNDPRTKIFKFKYCLRMFGLRLFRYTPLKIVIPTVLQLWSNIKFEKDVWIADHAIYDPQYLELGVFAHLGQAARIHTHDIIDGKLYIKKVKIGEGVLVGGFSHISPGVEIGNWSIVGGYAWVNRDSKFKDDILVAGNPAIAYPIDKVTKTAGTDKKYVD